MKAKVHRYHKSWYRLPPGHVYHVVEQIQVMNRSVLQFLYAYCSRGLNKYGRAGARAGMRVTSRY